MAWQGGWDAPLPRLLRADAHFRTIRLRMGIRYHLGCRYRKGGSRHHTKEKHTPAGSQWHHPWCYRVGMRECGNTNTEYGMLNILLYIWQLPQNLLGILLLAIYAGDNGQYKDAIVRRSVKMQGGISLGKYIIVSEDATKKSIMHEYGHCRQSIMLGWLFLLIVGLPSILHAVLCNCKDHSYSSVYPENWANKLGGVK